MSHKSIGDPGAIYGTFNVGDLHDVHATYVHGESKKSALLVFGSQYGSLRTGVFELIIGSKPMSV